MAFISATAKASEEDHIIRPLAGPPVSPRLSFLQQMKMLQVALQGSYPAGKMRGRRRHCPFSVSLEIFQKQVQFDTDFGEIATLHSTSCNYGDLCTGENLGLQIRISEEHKSAVKGHVSIQVESKTAFTFAPHSRVTILKK